MTKNNEKSVSVQQQLNYGEDVEKESLWAEIVRLREQYAGALTEIERLKQIMDSNIKSDNTSEERLSVTQRRYWTSITKKSSDEEKIACFRHYFRGREDVYAIRRVDKTGKSIYYPKRQYLGNENGKPLLGENLPLTDEVVKAHFDEKKKPLTIGIYPLLLDETCWFLAIDFDKNGWQEDTAAFLETCRQFHIPASLERSRSGNGGHIWIFFDEPIPARTARM